MTVYKYFLKLAYRYRGILIINIMIYLLIVGLNIFTSEDIEYDQLDRVKVKIGVIDRDGSKFSNSLIKYLENNDLGMIDLSEDEIKEEIYLEYYDLILEIPKYFEEKLKEGEEDLVKIYKNPRSSYGFQGENQIKKYLLYLDNMVRLNNINFKKLENLSKTSVDVNFIGENEVSLDREIIVGELFTSLVQPIIMCFIYIFGQIFKVMSEENMYKRILTSSKSTISYNKEIYLGELTVGLMIVSIFVVPIFIYGYKYIKLGKYFINLLAFSFSILSMSFLINNISNSSFFIDMSGTLLSLGLAFISGSFVNQRFLSEGVLKIARFFPPYYYIEINQSISRGDFLQIRRGIFIQVLFGITYVLIGLYVSKIKKEGS